MKVSPSILAAAPGDDASFSESIELAQRHGATYVHIDVMDGKFVEHSTVWDDPANIRKLKTSLPLDIHVMIDDPDGRVDEFLALKPYLLTFHIESAVNPLSIIERIHAAGSKAGVAINPETPFDALKTVLDHADHILVMTVNPGAAGQSFIPDALFKVRLIKSSHPNLEVEVDGGIDVESARLAKDAGADVIVSSSFIYRSENPAENLNRLRSI